MKYHSVNKFWFEEIDKKLWFKKDAAFDSVIRDRFLSTYNAAVENELYFWRDIAEGRLAEIIVLDQFSRNLFRNSARAFSNDSLALCLSQEAIRQGQDAQLTLVQRGFLYMPYMHSESLRIHEQAVQLFSQIGLENNLSFELRHKSIIERFGRYPHRNKILGRDSTKEEIQFLNQPGSSF